VLLGEEVQIILEIEAVLQTTGLQTAGLQTAGLQTAG